MTQSERKDKSKIELPSRSAYLLAAAILVINSLFSFILYYTTGITGVHMLWALIDIVLFILLVLRNDSARIIVLIRSFFGLIIGSIMILVKWKGAASIEVLIIQIIFCGGLMYILAGKTKKRHIFVGSVCILILLFYNALVLIALINKNNIT